MVEEFERQVVDLVVGALVERLDPKTAVNWVSLNRLQGRDLVLFPSLQSYLASKMFWRVDIRHPDFEPIHHLNHFVPHRYLPFSAVSQ